MGNKRVVSLIIVILLTCIFTATYLFETKSRRSISVGSLVSVEKGDLQLHFQPKVIKVNNTDAVSFTFELKNISNTTHNEYYRWWHFRVHIFNKTNGEELGTILETQYEPGLAYELSLKPGESLRGNYTWSSSSAFSGLKLYQPGEYLVSGVWSPQKEEMETPKTTLTITR
jgi:hypothetical protein